VLQPARGKLLPSDTSQTNTPPTALRAWNSKIISGQEWKNKERRRGHCRKSSPRESEAVQRGACTPTKGVAKNAVPTKGAEKKRREERKRMEKFYAVFPQKKTKGGSR